MDRVDDQLRNGDFEGALATLVEAVRADPADPRRRLALSEVLILTGDLVRADTHLNAAQGLDTSWGMAVALTRQLIRAATWRAETFDAGRPPELVTERTSAIDRALAALLAERDGSAPATDEDTALAAISGTVDGRAFSGWRDADDRTAGVLELLTSTGNYVWVPLTQVRSLKPSPVERYRDIVWRPTEIDVADGPSGIVYIPAIYHAVPTEMTALHRLGRATDWIEGGQVRGVGLRVWLAGDEDLALNDFALLETTG